MIKCYTDGACSYKSNSSDGGYAALIVSNDTILEYESKKVSDTTNNRMELYGLITGIRLLSKYSDKEKIVYSDSKYCINMINDWIYKWADNDWHTASGSLVKNLDLVKELYELDKSNITFEWVKAHSTDKYNNMVDRLAKGLPL